ncbi:MAG: hypothetical protein JNM97_23390 [Rhodoferax sp.]|nr:hypothetical protein [Rhodoferax sp.]
MMYELLSLASRVSEIAARVAVAIRTSLPLTGGMRIRARTPIVAIATAAMALGPQASWAGGWTPELSVASIFTEGTTDYLVAYTTDGTVYASGCAADSWVVPFDTTARGQRAYATLLAAATSGKKVRFWYLDTCGLWGYHQAHSVRLVN